MVIFSSVKGRNILGTKEDNKEAPKKVLDGHDLNKQESDRII